MMRFKFGNDRRYDWRCCFCCHVRTGTIILGVWQLLMHLLALSFLAVVIKYYPEIMEELDVVPFSGDDNNVSYQNKMNLAPALPTPLSSEFGENAEVRRFEMDVDLETFAEFPSREEASEKQLPPRKSGSSSFGFMLHNLGVNDIRNLRSGFIVCIVVTFCMLLITLLMVYGAMRNKPSYLMPFFCLQVFNLCIACLSALKFLCRIQDPNSIHLRWPLGSLLPQYVSFIFLLVETFSIALKAYCINMVWRCYKYLSLRRIAQLRTIHVIDTHNQAMAVASDTALSHQEALLLLPDYETAISDPRYAVPLKGASGEKAKSGGGQTSVSFDSLSSMAPPPPYSNVMQEANQVVPDKVLSVPATSASQERAVPASPEASPSRQEPQSSPAATAAARSNDDVQPPST